MSQALALATYLPDIITQTPNPGDVVEVSAVPVGKTPRTQFAANSSGGGSGGGVSLPKATTQGQVLIADVGPLFTPKWSDLDAGRF